MAKSSMKRKTNKTIFKVELEKAPGISGVDQEALASLVSVIHADVLMKDKSTRHEIAGVVREFGFDAYTGGRHVAILRRQVRLGMITATTPDFN